MNKNDIAIIGMSCRFPGANSAEEFWEIISTGKTFFGDIPEERKMQFDFEALKHRKGAFLEKPFHFDNAFFKISESEALAMDPQQRIMLELAVEAKENALISDFKDKNIGVFIGANQRAYSEIITAAMYKKQLLDQVKKLDSFDKISPEIKSELLAEFQKIEQSLPIDSSTITGNISNMIASRISHEFNLTGPSLTIDTACSSSLVAVHLACESLVKNECNMAYAGGVNLNLAPSIFLLMEAAQVISQSENCIPFSASSDGILLGEGAGFVILKRLDKAIEDEDRILSVIKGSGINNDGHSLGIMTPSWKGQLSLLETVYSKSNYDPKNISLIEAHGTSTPIGDSIEITVLQRFFSHPNQQLSIGSVKSNIGHLLGASGIAGLIKTVLALQKKKLPPSVFGEKVNPKWKLHETGFKIQDSVKDWETSNIRSAGVSAFGFGGTNAHIILEEPDPVYYKPKKTDYPQTKFSGRKFSYELFPGIKPKNAALFSIQWNPIEPEESEQVVNPDNWLLFCNETQIYIKEKLKTSGKNCRVVLPGKVYSRLDEFTFTINNSEENHLRWFFESLEKDKSYGIIFCPENSVEEKASDTIIQLLFLKHLIKFSSKYFPETIVWCITSNAFKVLAEDSTSPHQRAIATGFVGAVNENPALQGGLIDVDDFSEMNVDLILKSMGQNHNHPLIVRKQKLYLPSLLASSKTSIPDKRTEIADNGVYLIIGGSSGIGEEMAKFIDRKYSSRIIITGTRPADNLSETLKTHLNTNFEYIQSSVTDLDQVQKLMDYLFGKYERLNGIFLAAGTINYGLFASVNDAEFENTLSTKIQGVANLHKAIEKRDVDFIYLLSSVSAISPSRALGMSAYTAANAYLDAFAERYNSPATLWLSRAWSIWEETGMAKNMNLVGSNFLIPLKVPFALQLFEQSLKYAEPHLIAVHNTDAEKFTARWPEKKKTLKKAVKALPVEISLPPENKLPADFKNLLIKLIADATDLPVSEVDEHESFSNLGLDSISALDIVGELEKEYKLTLNPTLLYEYDSISRLSEFLQNLIPKTNTESFKLLPAQKAFFTNQVFYPDSPCNSMVNIEFNRQFDSEILQKAWIALIKKHDSLRLIFTMTDKGPMQRIIDIQSVDIEFIQLEGEENIKVKVKEIGHKMINKVYQLDKFPLFDLCCITINPEKSVLVFNVHHIITDAWSITILLKEMVGIYDAFLNGNPPSETDISPSFVSYITHIENKIPVEDSESGKNYWAQELNNIKPLNLPYKTETVKNKTEFRVLNDFFNIESTLKIENSAKEHKVTLLQMLVSAFFKMLQKVTNQNDLIIRLASENRDRSFTNIEKLTGCIADSIPLRVHLEENEELFQLNQKVKNKLMQAGIFKDNASVDYSGISRTNQQCGPVGIAPFGMSYINTDIFLKDLGADRPVIQTRAALPFTDLSFICLKQKGCLYLSWNYSSDTFSDETINEFNASFCKILLANSTGKSTAKEKKQTGELEMPGENLFPQLPLLHEKVFAACDLYNDKIAINDKGFLISYSDLKIKSYQIANALIRVGNGEKKVVGILEYPGASATAGILAILSSGSAYIPLDPDWPVGRIEDIIIHSGFDILITSSDHLQKLLLNDKIIGQLKNVLLTDDSKNDFKKTEKLNFISFHHESKVQLLPVPNKISSGSLAYVMYTSGTTGIPKGVMVNHGAVEVFLNWISEEFEINSNDKFIQTSSLGFGGSIRQMFSTLLAGGEMHPIDRFDFKDPKSLLQFINQREITILNTVPSVISAICEYIEKQDENEQIQKPEKLRLMLVGGEILHGSLVEKWKTHFGNSQRIINLYGSTETLVNATFHEIKNNFIYTNGVPVGKPRKGSHVLLLNEFGKLASHGEKGELFVGGPSIAQGYLNAKDTTSERFVELDLEGVTGVFYRTGDLGIKNSDGDCVFLGRNDNQIQLYGNRIEPEEIEAVLTSTEGIKRAAILDFKDENRHWLVAFIVLKNTSNEVAEMDVRNRVAEKLPSYMVPQKVEFIKELPLTHAGKADRLTLRKNYEIKNLPLQVLAEPTNTQLIVQNIWRKVLKTETAELNHDFFALGGDSISALEVLHFLRKEFPIAPKPITLFKKRTIAELAAVIDEINKHGKTTEENTSAFPTGNSLLKQNQIPLSVTQRGFFILNRLNPESSPNLVASIPVKGKIDNQKLQTALNYLVSRHLILRTRFITKGLNTYQEVIPVINAEINFKDVSKLPEAQKQRTIRTFFQDYKKLNFILSELPLYSLTVFNISELSSVFLFCIHHIIGDSWSMKILTDELLVVYEQLQNDDPVSLPNLQSSFLDLVNAESKTPVSSPQIKSLQTEFWQNQFKDLPSASIAKKWLSSENDEEKVTLVVQNTQKEKLKTICSNQGISLFQLLFTVYARALQYVLKTNRLLINTSVSGRDLSIPGIENIIGCFARSLPVHVQFAENNLLLNIKELEQAFIESSENNEIPPNDLIKLYMESGAPSMQSMYRFFISSMDFSALSAHKSQLLDFNWDDADFFFNAGSVESELFIGIRISGNILISFNGITNSLFKTEVKNQMQKDIDYFLQPALHSKEARSLQKNEIDSALIAYFPSLGSLSELLPGGKLNKDLVKGFIKKLMPDNEPQLLETEQTRFGRTGVVFLPFYAEELSTMKQEELLPSILKAVEICMQNGARYISLAGNLPSKTNYGFSVSDAVKDSVNSNEQIEITTGHSCTVVAVVKTIEKVITQLKLDITSLTLGVAGFGSIGQSSLHLLLAKIGLPAAIKIADLKTQMSGLKKSFIDVEKVFTNQIEVISVEKTMPDEFYSANLIIGASSNGEIIDVAKLRPGTILVDDSFPHIIDVKKAITRMKEEKDVIIVGAGKLDVGKKEREIIKSVLPGKWIQNSIEKFGDEGLPGCQLESLLMSFDKTLPGTIGLVNQTNAIKFWDKTGELKLGAVGFHLQGFHVDNSVLQKTKDILKNSL